jgi:hypothetical protein
VIAAVDHPAAATRATRPGRAGRARAQEDRGEVEGERRLPDACRPRQQQRVGRARLDNCPRRGERGRLATGTEAVHNDRAGRSGGQVVDVSVDALRRVVRGFGEAPAGVAFAAGLRTVVRRFGAAFGAPAAPPDAEVDAVAPVRRAAVRFGAAVSAPAWPATSGVSPAPGDARRAVRRFGAAASAAPLAGASVTGDSATRLAGGATAGPLFGRVESCARSIASSSGGTSLHSPPPPPAPPPRGPAGLGGRAGRSWRWKPVSRGRSRPDTSG